jgi:hypothetical protein
MKEKFWLCKRESRYFSLDSEIGKRQSLRTRDKADAKKLVQAKNNVVREPAMNLPSALSFKSGSVVIT